MQVFRSRWLALVSGGALALGTLFVASPAMAAKPKEEAQAQQPQANYSKGFRKEGAKVSKLVSEQKWDEVLAAIPAVEALEGLTDDDRRALYQWKVLAYQGKQDWPAVATTYAAWADSGLVEPARVPEYYRQVAAIYSSRLKDNAQTLVYFRKSVAATQDPSEEDLHTLIMLTRQQKDCAGLIEWTDKATQIQVRRGAGPRETWLQFLDGCYVESGAKEKRLANLEELAKRFPKRDYYTRINTLYQQGSNDDRIVMINMLRLAMRDVGLATVGEYLNYADTATALGSPGETVRALEKGMAEGMVPKVGSNQQMLSEARAAIAMDKKSLPAEEKAAAKAAKGEVDVKVALGFFGVGDYQRALENVERGLAKGGVKRLDDAHLLHGILLVELGRKPEAVTAFEASAKAAGPGAWLGRVANLWAAYAARPAPAPAAAAPATPPSGT
ncbi:MAG: hypothetical protein IT483_12650 [Gammaproteobacteria bacterium]|nr:hypothetical protein [Gammaproteobacteria bacterium]